MEQILERIRQFRDERDWMKFHDPKNLSISITIEAAELLEHFQWKDEDAVASHVSQNLESISDEIADIAIYLLELADNLGIDLTTAINSKLDKNEKRYPADKARGVATKYTDL